MTNATRIKLREPDVMVRFIRLRIKLGSQKSLAGKLGISESYLSDMINHRRALSDELLEMLGVDRYTVYEADSGWDP